MTAFHHMQPFDPAGNVHASSVTRTMKGQSLDTWDMFTRESLQNSWDARDTTSHEDGVTFAIDYKDLSLQQVKTLRHDVLVDDVKGLDGLRAALDSGSIRMLSVSDSGTNGLRGPSIASTVTKDSSAPRDFDSFVRNIGRSDSKTLKGGTYGFGKGVFFIVSRVNTIMVYTRTVDENSNPVHRFISMANSSDFQLGDTLYTGRHWWGIKKTGQSGNNTTEYAEPFTGERADRLARALGMDGYFTDERATGTCIAVLEPDIEDVDEGLEKIAGSLTRWAWPHMVRFEKTMDPIEFHVRKNGEEINIPDPNKDQAVRHYVRAYKDALEIPRDLKNSWESDFRHRVTRIWAERPRKELGRLAVVNIPDVIAPESTVLEQEIEHEIALLRNPRMVVEYWRGPKNLSGTPYCGVFLADGVADPVFARSEPAAHHEWNHQAIQNDHELLQQFWGSKTRSNPVKILKDKMRALLKESKSTTQPEGESKHFQALTQMSSRLGSIVSNAVGGTDAGVPVRKEKDPVNNSKPSVGKKPRSNIQLASMFRAQGSVISVFKVDFAVPENMLPISANATPYLAADRGSIKEAEARGFGIEFPEVQGWSASSTAPQSLNDISDTKNTVEVKESQMARFVLVSQPADSATGITIEFSSEKEATGEA